MGIRQVAVDSPLVRTTSPPSPSKMSGCCWARQVAVTAVGSGFFGFQDLNNTGYYATLYFGSSAPPQPALWLNPTANNFGPTCPLNEWRFFAFTLSGSSGAYTWKCYYSLIKDVAMTLGLTQSDTTAFSSWDHWNILGDAEGETCNGNVACARLWSDLLTPDEFFQEKNSIYAVKRANLLGDYPLFTPESAAKDYSPLQLPLTVGSTVPKFEGTFPPIPGIPR